MIQFTCVAAENLKRLFFVPQMGKWADKVLGVVLVEPVANTASFKEWSSTKVCIATVVDEVSQLAMVILVKSMVMYNIAGSF